MKRWNSTKPRASVPASSWRPSRKTRSDGHEDVVEDRHGLDHLARRRERVLRLALALRREVRARDQRQPGRVERDRERDRVVGVGRRHRPRRQHDHLVGVDRDRRVDLRAAHDDPVGAPLDDPHVRVGVALLGRAQRTVALDVGLGDADREVAVAAVLVERPNRASRVRLAELVRERQQREQRVAADLLDQQHERLPGPRRGLDQRAAREQVVAVTRHVEVAARAVGPDRQPAVLGAVGELEVERGVVDAVATGPDAS